MGMNPTVLVIGTGRSGTSTVAKLCHEHFGVCMGHYLKVPNESNLNGYYEDYLADGLLHHAVKGGLTPDLFLDYMNHSHKDCEHWGVKNHQLSELNYRYLSVINPKLIIRTWRPIGATVKSWLQKDLRRGKPITPESEELFYNECLRREALMDKNLKHFNVLTIRFDRQVPEEELIEGIGVYI